MQLTQCAFCSRRSAAVDEAHRFCCLAFQEDLLPNLEIHQKPQSRSMRLPAGPVLTRDFAHQIGIEKPSAQSSRAGHKLVDQAREPLLQPASHRNGEAHLSSSANLRWNEIANCLPQYCFCLPSAKLHLRRQRYDVFHEFVVEKRNATLD